MNPKSLTIIAIVTSILAILLLLNTCRLNRKITSQSSQITQQQLDNQEVTSLSNKQRQTISQQEVIITSSQSSINHLTDTIFNLKKKDSHNQEVIAYYKGKTNTIITETMIPYLDTATLSHALDSVSQSTLSYIRDSMVKVGTIAQASTPNYYLSQSIQQRGIKIDSLSIPDILQLQFIEKKGGLFKKSSIQVQYFHTNPLVRTTGSNSVIYIPRKKSFFTRVLLPVVVGVGAGLLIK